MNHHQAHFLLVGDASDIPAIRDILLRLPVDAYGQVFLEVGSVIRIQRLPLPEAMSVTWLRRDERSSVVDAVPPRGELVTRAVSAWISEWMPEDLCEHATPYVLWIGCSASERVDRLYEELQTRMPDLHLHHPHSDVA